MAAVVRQKQGVGNLLETPLKFTKLNPVSSFSLMRNALSSLPGSTIRARIIKSSMECFPVSRSVTRSP